MRKSKKFLALLTALSISASAFAGLATTAFAASNGIEYSFENKKLTITYDAETSAKLLVAKYKGNTLNSLTVEDLTLKNGATEVEKELKLNDVVMVWDRLDTMTPLVKKFVTPIDPASIYYKQDFEDYDKDTNTYMTGAEGNTTEKEKWASQYYYAGVGMKNDPKSAIHTHFVYTNNMTARKGPRTAYFILPDEAGQLDEEKMAVAEFDFNFKANTGNQLVLIGNSATPIGNGQYSNAEGVKPAGEAPILKLTQGSGEDFTVNDNETAVSSGYKKNTWAHAKVVMNFSTKTVILTITSLDGKDTYFETAQVAMGAGDKAEKLSQIFVCGNSSGVGTIGVDNIVVRKVLDGDIGDKYYNATFNTDGKETKLSAKEGEKLETVPDTTKTGYIFDGWAKDGDKTPEKLLSSETILDTPMTADVSYEAIYHRNPDYIEPMVSLSLTMPQNNMPVLGADADTAADNPIQVKITGEIGGDLGGKDFDKRIEDFDVKWELKGFRHIVSKAQAGENAATTDAVDSNEYCDSYAKIIYDETDKTKINFQQKGHPFNFYGELVATVTYGGKEMTVSQPMAVLPNKVSTGDLLPKAGYVENFDWYSNDMVGYKAVTSADNKGAVDVATGDWAAYGGNTGRGLYIAKDETTGKNFLKLKSTGTNSSSFAVNKLDSAPEGQVIVTQDVKFYNNNSSILFKQDNPVTWDAKDTPAEECKSTSYSINFTGSELNINNSKICDASAGEWYRIVASLDTTSKLCYAKAYDMDGQLLGSSEVVSFSGLKATAPTYYCFRTPDNAQGELDFNNVRIYTPSIDESKFTITAVDENMSIPKEGKDPVTTQITATALSDEGYDMIGEAEWKFDSSVADTSSLEITPSAENSHIATLTVKAGAPAGELPINVTIGGTTKQIKINLTSSQDSIQFTKSTASISIPIEDGTSNDYEYAAKVMGPTSEEDETPIEIEGKTVTYAVYDKNNANELETLPNGITFDADTATLTVTNEAVATVLNIRATSTNRKDEVITKSVKVTIHGLAFDFGTGDDGAVAEGSTAVTPETLYSTDTGYGIENGGKATAGGEPSIDNADSDNLTGTFTFKAKVPASKVYKVKVNYTGTAAAEKYNVDLSGIDLASDQIQKAEDGSFLIPVIDDELDITFTNATVSSIVIEKVADKKKRLKPHIFTVGDSTIANNGSFAYVMERDYSTYENLPEIASFSNNGRGGKNLGTYYTGGEFSGRVLASICPGDYVMIGDMGTNGVGSKYEESFNYYIDACEALGAKVIINSYTPHGAVNGDKTWYDSAAQTFNGWRQDDYDKIVRKIYEERTTIGGEKYDANIVGFVEIGKNADASFNAYVDDYEAKGYASRAEAAQAIYSCFTDHNHYSAGTIACQLMINGYGGTKGIVAQLYEIVSADLAK